MRIVVIASGSRGDVEPYVALGQGLARAGHAVRLLTHADYEGLVSARGVEFWPLEGHIQDIVQSAAMRERLERGNFLAILSLMAKEAQRGAIALARGGLAACSGTDLLVAGIGGGFVGLALAEKLGLPLVQAYYIPLTPTRAYPRFALPGLPAWLGGVANRPSYHLVRQMLWQPFRSADRRARREVLKLPAAPFWGAFDAACTRGSPVLYGYSPSVIPPPPDWDERIQVTGYWFLDPAADWTPPAELTEFLKAGAPPVYVGFGSMSSRNPQETAALVLGALERAGLRAIILSGWGGLQQGDLPPSVMMVQSVPFAWLFPRVAAVVHHGGAGTTAAGLRAGVPAVIVPFFGDQPFWGQRVAELGAGPAPLPRKRLTVERLAQAMRQAVTDGQMRQRAAELGARIRAEDGVARAVEAIAQIEKRTVGPRN